MKVHFSISISVIAVCILIFAQDTKAQVTEIGLNAGVVANRYTVSTNRIEGGDLLRQGDIRYSPRIGVQYTYGAPRDQNLRKLTLKHELLSELSICRCGGNTEILSDPNNGDYITNSLSYYTWQVDFSFMYMARLGNLRLFGGPAVTYNYYRGFKQSQLGNELQTASRQINPFYIGYEVGLGWRRNKTMYSARYHTALTKFSQETNLVPASYNIHQLRLIFSYFLFEAATAKNWGSIYR